MNDSDEIFIRNWLTAKLPQFSEQIQSDASLHQVLKSGVILCNLINTISPGSVGKIKDSKIAFVQIENVTAYIKACKTLGFYTFDTSDLSDNRGMDLVKRNIKAIAARYPMKDIVLQEKSNLEIEVAYAESENDIDIAIYSKMRGGGRVTNIDEDVLIKKQLKYSSSLERKIKKWISEVLEEELKGGSIHAVFRDGVYLCRVIYTLFPDVEQLKIYTGKVAYSQMENILHFVSACQEIGLNNTEIFDTNDLFENKDMGNVLNTIYTLAKKAEGTTGYQGPILPDEGNESSNILGDVLLGKTIDLGSNVQEFTDDDSDLISWANEHQKEKLNNWGEFRSSLPFIYLLKSVAGAFIVGYIEEPQQVLDYMHNATILLQSIRSITYERITFCSVQDIVNGELEQIKELLNYLREKFDMLLQYHKLLEEAGLKEEDLELDESNDLAPIEEEAIFVDTPIIKDTEKKTKKPKKSSTKKEKKSSKDRYKLRLKEKKMKEKSKTEKSSKSPRRIRSSSTEKKVDVPVKSKTPRSDPPRRARATEPAPLPKLKSQSAEVSNKKREVNMRMSHNVAKEILETEKNYVKFLDSLYQNLYLPVKASNDLSRKEFKVIFSDLEIILNRHTGFLEKLTPVIDEWGSHSLGTFFIENCDFVQLYERYLMNYQCVEAYIKWLRHHKPKLDKALREFDRTSPLDTVSILIMPVQRLPRYILLLREIVKFTDDAEEITNLKNASTLVSDALSEHNSKIDNDFMIQYMEVINIKDSVEGLLDENNFPFSPSRMLIGVYETKVKHPEKSLSKLAGSKIYLFDDSILYTRKKSKVEEFVDFLFTEQIQEISHNGGKVTISTEKGEWELALKGRSDEFIQNFRE